jgi:hypothetical protein
MNASSNPSSASLAQTLDFHIPEAEDAVWARPLLQNAARQGCEYTFGNILAYRAGYHTQIAQYNGWFFSFSQWEPSGARSYAFPVGGTNVGAAIEILRAYTRGRGETLRLFGLTKADTQALDAACPGQFRYRAMREDFDYIYATQDLAQLPGKKYHQKRTAARHFYRENDWTYVPLEGEAALRQEALDFCALWRTQNAARGAADFAREYDSIELFLRHFETLEGKGALLKVGQRVVAFTAGEDAYPGCFVTHYEKALTEYPGAYQAINQRFAANALTDYTLINREEDVGDEGLRQVKLSYHPTILLEKFSAYSADEARG